MSDIFISYARPSEADAERIGEALRALGYGIWRDDELLAHRSYTEVIEERLRAAKVVIVVWSAAAVKSQWVRAEANLARGEGKLVQLRIDDAVPPLPFNEIQCADLSGWTGADTPGWRQVLASIAHLHAPGVAEVATSFAPAALPAGKPSIAVLPFTNMSTDATQAYFTEGMHEEIVTALTRSRSLSIIATGAGVARAITRGALSTSGGGSGVRYVLEASVRKAADRVRIAVKLSDATSGAQMWSERFEDNLDDVFALQDRVALHVAAAIEPTVEGAEVRRAARRPPDHHDSYDLYLRALPLYWSYEKPELERALEYLDRAATLDPAFGPALALAATCHRLLLEIAWTDADADERIAQHRERGIDYAVRALRVADDDARTLAHIASAFMGLEPTLDRAAEVIGRALMLNSGCAFAWMVAGLISVRQGEAERAITQLDTAVRLEPQSRLALVARWYKGVAMLLQRHFNAALALSGETNGAMPALRLALLASLHGHLGRAGDAQAALAGYRALASAPVERMFDWAHRAEDRAMLTKGVRLAQGELA